MLKEFTQQYQLTAGECNPELEMPLPLLMTRIIEIATLHANSWGVGYAKLIEENQAWVLSRVTIEMTRYPRVNEIYSVTTWIEDYNRHFSLRNMEFKAADGSTLGYARTVWVVINLATRESVDISKLSYIRENVLGKECPIAAQGRLKLQQVTHSQDHTFGYVECDLNRHVNTVRYLELLLNQFPL
ncbi:MAG: acyl-[Muribaculaceae bacterium]|nr:acyl-[acyl-carrier-protein] thioesterase [Muribaculaceae bacterium]